MNKIFFIVIMLLTLNTFAMENGQKWDGTFYKENSALQTAAALSCIKDLEIESGKYKYMCDIGSGTGDVTATIADMCPNSKIVGFDASFSQIQKAVEAYKNKGNLRFYCTYAEKIEENETFDLIVSFNAWHWIEHQQEALNCAWRSLSPGGCLFISMNGKSCEGPLEESFNLPILQAILKTGYSDIWKNHFQNVDLNKEFFPLYKETMRTMLENAGFEKIDIKSFNRTRKVPNVNLFSGFLAGFLGGCPSIAKLNSDQFIDFINDLVKNYLEIVPLNEDGSVNYEGRVLMAKAFKPNEN